VQNIKDQTGLETIIVTSLADMLPTVKRTLINFVIKNVKKMVPAYSLPSAIRLRKALSLGKGKGFKPAHMANPEDTIILQYTGGTTGLSKGAALSHGNLVSNIMMYDAVAGEITLEGR
jgi:long-chain acyl-CoA synthetase